MDFRYFRTARLRSYKAGYRLLTTDRYLAGLAFLRLWNSGTGDLASVLAEMDTNAGRPARSFLVIPESPTLSQIASTQTGIVEKWHSSQFRAYRPFEVEHGSLFKVFAETPATPEGILAFANRFGMLHSSIKRQFAVLGPGGALWTGELIDDWYSEIGAMRACAEVWSCLTHGRIEDIERCLARIRADHETQADRTTDAVSESVNRLLASTEHSSCRLTDMSETHTSPGVLNLLATTLIKDMTNPRLGSALEASLEQDDTFALKLSYSVSSLVATVWFQFAVAVDQNKQYERCVECQAWFEVAPGLARTNRVYCSNACRSRAYRRRQARAREMSADGVSVQKIAEHLGTDSETVGRWLASEK